MKLNILKHTALAIFCLSVFPTEAAKIGDNDIKTASNSLKKLASAHKADVASWVKNNMSEAYHKKYLDAIKSVDAKGKDHIKYVMNSDIYMYLLFQERDKNLAAKWIDYKEQVNTFDDQVKQLKSKNHSYDKVYGKLKKEAKALAKLENEVTLEKSEAYLIHLTEEVGKLKKDTQAKTRLLQMIKKEKKSIKEYKRNFDLKDETKSIINSHYSSKWWVFNVHS